MSVVRRIEEDDDKFLKAARLLLLQPRIEINKQNEFNATALHQACKNGVKSHIGAKILIKEAGCDVNMQDIRGQTPLMYAVKNIQIPNDEFFKIAEMILKHSETDKAIADLDNDEIFKFYLKSMRGANKER